MQLDPTVRDEWRDHHWLTPTALRWIALHGDPGDPHPIATAITALCGMEVAAESAELTSIRRPF